MVSNCEQKPSQTDVAAAISTESVHRLAKGDNIGSESGKFSHAHTKALQSESRMTFGVPPHVMQPPVRDSCTQVRKSL